MSSTLLDDIKRRGDKRLLVPQVISDNMDLEWYKGLGTYEDWKLATPAEKAKMVAEVENQIGKPPLLS